MDKVIVFVLFTCAVFIVMYLIKEEWFRKRYVVESFLNERILTLTTHVENLKVDLQFKVDEINELKIRKYARFNNEDCYIYHEDEDNHLESLVCPVVVTPQYLMSLQNQISILQYDVQLLRDKMSKVNTRKEDEEVLINTTLANNKDSVGTGKVKYLPCPKCNTSGVLDFGIKPHCNCHGVGFISLDRLKEFL